MTREFYRAQLKAYKLKEYKSMADALFDAAYLLGMWSMEGYDADDPIRLEMIGLAANNACRIDRDIREGKLIQKMLKNLSDETEP